jgi:hypothetical protein
LTGNFPMMTIFSTIPQARKCGHRFQNSRDKQIQQDRPVHGTGTPDETEGEWGRRLG